MFVWNMYPICGRSSLQTACCGGSAQEGRQYPDFFMIPGYFSTFLNSILPVCVICLHFYCSPKLFLCQNIWAHVTTSSQISGLRKKHKCKRKNSEKYILILKFFFQNFMIFPCMEFFKAEFRVSGNPDNVSTGQKSSKSQNFILSHWYAHTCNMWTCPWTKIAGLKVFKILFCPLTS